MFMNKLSESNSQQTVNFNVLYEALKISKLFEVLIMFTYMYRLLAIFDKLHLYAPILHLF